MGHAIETLWMVMAEAERRDDEILYSRSCALFRAHVDAAWDDECGGVYRGAHLRRNASARFLDDSDCKVKWAHDEVCGIHEGAQTLDYRCALLLAPCLPRPSALTSPDV